MNIIAFDAAYSLYPRATFEERRSLSFANLTERDFRALGKYTLRGWSTLSNIWPHELEAAQALFYIGQERSVTDRFSWVVPLNTTGVELRSRPSALSQPFTWDPVLHNSWGIVKPHLSSKMYMSYHILKPTIFRYAYLFADLEVIHNMACFLKQQGSFEHRKMGEIPVEQKGALWTWYSISSHPP